MRLFRHAPLAPGARQMTRRGLLGSGAAAIAAFFLPAGRLFGMPRAEPSALVDFTVAFGPFSETGRNRYVVVAPKRGLDAPLYPTETVGDPLMRRMLPAARDAAAKLLRLDGDTAYDASRAKWVDEDGRILVRGRKLGEFEAWLRIPRNDVPDVPPWNPPAGWSLEVWSPE